MTSIRQATLNDSKVINLLSEALGYGVVSEDVARDRFHRILESDNDKVWVYEENGQVFGWIHAFTTLRVASDSFVEIGGLVVDPTLRKRGVGRVLVKEVMQWAAEQQVSLRVRCNALRSDTHLFYEAIGFNKSKEQYVFDSRY